MNGLKSYIKKITGFDLKTYTSNAEAINRLPLFVREGYKFTCVEFYERQIVFIEPKSSIDVTPTRLQKDIPKIEFAFERPVILVLDELTYYLKTQLIRSKIAFVVPDNQLFVPFMFMDLKEQNKIRKRQTDYFSPSTQCVLIYHLWVKSLFGLNFQQIAELFDYSPRTIGRCAEEIEKVGLCNIIGTKSKLIEFTMNNQELWKHALNYMISPIQESKWLFIKPDTTTKCILSGISALSKYTDISTIKTTTFAIDSTSYRDLRNKGELTDIIYNDYGLELQVWKYNPLLLAKNDVVDPFSLYLSLKDDSDERVQIELEHMMEKVLQ